MYVFTFRLMVTIALHNEARVLTLLFSRMAGSTVCAYCHTGQYLNTSGDLAALLRIFSMITRYDLNMVHMSAETAQKSADPVFVETNYSVNSAHTL